MQKKQFQRRTQGERKAESERKLISAARRLIAKQGYLRTTLKEVGDVAGYTGPLVTARFGSKEALLKAVVNHIATRFRRDQVLPVTEAKSATATLNNYIEVYLSEVGKRESHMRALYAIMGEAVSAVPEIRSEVAALSRGMRKSWSLVIQRGIDSGEFRADVDPEAAAVLIVGLLRGITMQALLDPRQVKTKELVPLVQQQVLRSLT